MCFYLQNCLFILNQTITCKKRNKVVTLNNPIYLNIERR